MAAKSSGKGNYFAAIRLHIENRAKQVVHVEDILNFEAARKPPYNAFIQTGLNTKGSPIYEAGIVLEISNDTDKLSLPDKRHHAPKLRRSDVMNELLDELKLKSDENMLKNFQVNQKKTKDAEKTKKVKDINEIPFNKQRCKEALDRPLVFETAASENTTAEQSRTILQMQLYIQELEIHNQRLLAASQGDSMGSSSASDLLSTKISKKHSMKERLSKTNPKDEGSQALLSNTKTVKPTVNATMSIPSIQTGYKVYSNKKKIDKKPCGLVCEESKALPQRPRLSNLSNIGEGVSYRSKSSDKSIPNFVPRESTEPKKKSLETKVQRSVDEACRNVMDENLFSLKQRDFDNLAGIQERSFNHEDRPPLNSRVLSPIISKKRFKKKSLNKTNPTKGGNQDLPSLDYSKTVNPTINATIPIMPSIQKGLRVYTNKRKLNPNSCGSVVGESKALPKTPRLFNSNHVHGPHSNLKVQDQTDNVPVRPKGENPKERKYETYADTCNIYSCSYPLGVNNDKGESARSSLFEEGYFDRTVSSNKSNENEDTENEDPHMSIDSADFSIRTKPSTRESSGSKKENLEPNRNFMDESLFSTHTPHANLRAHEQESGVRNAKNVEESRKEKNYKLVSTQGKTKNSRKKLQKRRKVEQKNRVYDSDDYQNSDASNKMEKLTPWNEEYVDQVTDEVKRVKKMHLNYGISVPYKAWTRARNAKTASSFVRKLAPHLWNREELLKKAVNLEKTDDPENREALSPKKEGALKSVYKRYLQMNNQLRNMDGKAKERRINKYRRELGIFINQERQKHFKEESESEESGEESGAESEEAENN